MITIALAKGRLSDLSIEILEKCGIDCAQVRDPGRKLILTEPTGEYTFILVKPTDVPTYVDHGVADMGICGKDTLLEENLPLYELIDLKFGACKMCVCGFLQKPPAVGGVLRVATKYPNIARNLYAARGVNAEVIKLNGSVELGPLIGLSDVILDIVQTGETLNANGLVVLEDICDISARAVVNKVSLKTKRTQMNALITTIKQVMETV